MRLKRRFEAGGECLYVIDHRPQRPESIVRVLLPIDALCVEEDTGTRTIQILRDLTADVAQIEIGRAGVARSEEHTSELQSLMRNSYAVFCLKKKTTNKKQPNTKHHTRQDIERTAKN